MSNKPGGDLFGQSLNITGRTVVDRFRNINGKNLNIRTINEVPYVPFVGVQNLTGPITSVGTTTSVASQTGTGSTFVMDNTPTLITPDIGAATGTSLTVTGQVASTAVTDQIVLGTTNTTTLTAPAPGASMTLTLPSTASDTLVARDTTDSLTNKTLTDSTNNVIARELWNDSGAASVSTYAAVAPSVGQVLTATSATAATWQTPSSGSITITPFVIGPNLGGSLVNTTAVTVLETGFTFSFNPTLKIVTTNFTIEGTTNMIFSAAFPPGSVSVYDGANIGNGSQSYSFVFESPSAGGNGTVTFASDGSITIAGRGGGTLLFTLSRTLQE